MYYHSIFLVLLALLTSAHAGEYDKEQEVCVIGGGAAGSYAAYQLKKRGYAVSLLEPRNELGGNCKSFTMPSGSVVNAAVIYFSNTPIVTDYFNDLGITYVTVASRTPPINFLFDVPYPFVVPQPPVNQTLQLAALEQYRNVYANVFQSIPEQDEVPDFSTLPAPLRDALLAPFGYTVAVYGLGYLAPTFAALDQGMGPIFQIPTYYALKSASPTLIENLILGTFLNVLPGCKAIYTAVDNYLGDSAVLGVSDIQVKRKSGYNEVKFFDPQVGEDQKFKCDNVIVAFRPTSASMNAMFEDLTYTETSLYSAIQAPGFWTTIWNMTHPSLPDAILGLQHLKFIGVDVPSIPNQPCITNIVKQNAGVNDPFVVFYHAPTPLDAASVEATIQSQLQSVGFQNVQKYFFEEHKYGLRPDVASAAAGWYGNFKALQGYKKTFYIGSVLSWDASEFTWLHARSLLNSYFPPKN
jgi:hypothetical protein